MRTKRCLFIILSGLLVLASFPVTALAKENPAAGSGEYSAKDEVIYGNLDANGNINNMYVVNSFVVTEPGEIVDYGKYTNTRNLTDLSEIKQIGEDEVHFQAEDAAFYYQGELENQALPWDIAITYVLDGEKVNPDQLAGQSGNIEIQLTTSANKKVNPLFFERFLLQISLTLDPAIFHDIQAPKGTEANEGKNKQMTFTVMPEQEEVLIVSAQVTDFKMEPIDISAIPANIALEDPDIGNMTGDMKSLSDAIREINSGVAALNNGISELHDGASELSSGSTTYQNGINELDQSSAELVNGSKEIRDVLRQVSGAIQGTFDLPEMEDLEELPQALREIAHGLRESSEIVATLAGAIEEIPVIRDDQIEKLKESISENDPDGSLAVVLQQLVSTYEEAQAIKVIYDENQADLKNISSQSHEMANQLEAMADEIESSMKDLDQLGSLADLQNGITTLSSEYDTFHQGLVSYTTGVNELATSYQALDAGIKKLASGTAALKDGANELSEGTRELQKSTSDLPDEMQSELEVFMEEYDFSDFEAASFISDENKNVGVVQFVLQTERIEVEEPETDTEEKDEKKGFWARIKDLFK